jgi:hypothetical protein
MCGFPFRLLLSRSGIACAFVYFPISSATSLCFFFFFFFFFANQLINNVRFPYASDPFFLC